MSQERLTAELVRLLGEAEFIRLAEKFGGTALYVPASPDGTKVAACLGHVTAQQLASRYAGSYLRVPLAREMRAMHYRGQGKSNAEIARRLGLTMRGVERMVARMRRSDGHAITTSQTDLFS